MSLDYLRKDLFERFVTACDEIGYINEKKELAVKTVYATRSLFDVEKYKNGSIPSGGKLLSIRPEQDAYIYGLDSQSRPCHSQSEHTWNKKSWEGFYNYSDTLVEYVEFSCESGKPVAIVRLHLENGRRIAFQYFKINGGGIGRTYEGLGNQEIADKLQRSKYDLFCRLELYHYEQDRIVAADCWSMLPGAGANFYKQLYTYDTFGKLEDVKQEFQNNTSQYIFVEQPSELTFQELSDKVSLLIANAIADSVSQEEFNSPISIMQLSYREVANYDPCVSIFTEEQQQGILENSPKGDLLEELFILSGKEILFDASGYDRLLTAFLNKVEEDNDYDLATTMIRKAANLLTTQKLFGKAKVSKDFIAYAVDWSLIPNDLDDTMLECGMTADRLKWWQSLGLFLREKED